MYININVLNFGEKLLTTKCTTLKRLLRYLLYGLNNKKDSQPFSLEFILMILPEGLTDVGRAYGGLEAFQIWKHKRKI